jgi:hypothetical protein
MSILFQNRTDACVSITTNQKVRHGGFFTLIGLLVVIAIMLSLYSMQFSSTIPMALELAEDVNGNDQHHLKPWHEVDRIDNDHYLGNNQPERDHALFYDNVKLINEANAERRGKIDVSIDGDGSIKSNWFGSYSSDDKEYDIQEGKMKGSTDPSLIYENKQGERDDTKLFFIGTGNFFLVKYQTSKTNIIKGNIYITGWLNNDLSIEGSIHLTQDFKNQTIFKFYASAPTNYLFRSK